MPDTPILSRSTCVKQQPERAIAIATAFRALMQSTRFAADKAANLNGDISTHINEDLPWN
jgi:hypothetical protein